MPFFLGLYDLPGAGASDPNYDLNLLAVNAVQRCELHPNNEQKGKPLMHFRPGIRLPESLLFPRLLRLDDPCRHPCLYLSYVRQQVRCLPRGIPRSEHTKVLLRDDGDR